MVKVNLMDIPEEQKSSGERKRDSSESESTKSKVDLPFFPDQEEKTAADTETKSSFFDEESPRRTKSFGKEQFKSEYEEEPPAFDSNFPRNRMILILGGIGLLLILLFVYLWLGPGSGEPEVNPDINFTTPGEVTGTPEPQGTLPNYVSARFSQNQAENQLDVNYAKNFFDSATSNAAYFMLTLTSGQIYISVLGDSRDAIAEYRRSIKDHYPGMLLNIESIQDKYVDGEKKIWADFSIPISTAGSGGSSAAIQTSSSPDVRSAITSLGQRHNLQISYFQQGDSEREGQFQKTYYYTLVNGGRASVVSFLQEISQSYPGMNFIKISIYPLNSSSINGGSVNARIELAYFNPA